MEDEENLSKSSQKILKSLQEKRKAEDEDSVTADSVGEEQKGGDA